MISDSIPMSASNSRDFAKKKRANRSAKLKRCKLDARREQWLSQVKGKRGKEEINGEEGNTHEKSTYASYENNRPMKNLEINPGIDENDGSMHQYSDSESPSDSPNSSLLGGNDSGTNFTGSSRSSSSSSSSSGGCCSGSISEEDEGGCLDDWEAVADALAATENKQEQEEQQNPDLDLPSENVSVGQADSQREPTCLPASRVESSKPKIGCETIEHRPPGNRRAWTPEDAFRPQSLPNLSKQMSFPLNPRHYGRGGNLWVCKNVAPAPSPCPICCEELDLTDSSFLPCLCGFRLCLFCHKRILEQDGRCPGCRRQYDHNNPVEGEATLDGGSLAFRLNRSCSMLSRS